LFWLIPSVLASLLGGVVNTWLFLVRVPSQLAPFIGKCRRTAPNGHLLRHPNVIVAHWPRPGTGQLVWAWYCKTCKKTIYDD
jgi:hypothetical protein